MKRIFFLSVFTFLIFISTVLNAEVKLPAILGSGMVLQQQTDAAIWGKANANKTVKVTTSWNKKSYSVKSDSNGSWKVKVATPEAGGPYSITITDGKAITLEMF